MEHDPEEAAKKKRVESFMRPFKRLLADRNCLLLLLLLLLSLLLLLLTGSCWSGRFGRERIGL